MNVLKKIAQWIAPGKEPRRQIVINVERLESRVAILDDNELEDLFVERADEERIVGSIFKGRVQNLEDNLQAAFVDLGIKRNAFVHYWDMIPEDAARLEAEEGIESARPSRRKRQLADEIAAKYPVGSEIVVQVTKAGIGAKGPRVSANLSVAGRYLVMMPGTRMRGVSRRIDDRTERERLKKVLARLPLPDGVGMIVRTAGLGTRRTAFARDARFLLDIWNQISAGIREQPAPCRLYQEPDLVERVVRDALTESIDRILVDSRAEYDRIRMLVSRISRRGRNRIQLYDGAEPIFEYCEVERQILHSFRRKVWLQSGGYIVIDETEALVAIDVNTGRHKGGNTQEESILQVNLEAAAEIARQIRLRNIGGLIVLDFIDMKSRKDQNAVLRKMRECLRRDKARTNVLPISDLGLMEMTRQRVAESLRAFVFVNCPYCEGKGKVKSAFSMSVEIQRHLGEIMRRRNGNKEALRISVNPAILERLRKEDEETLVQMEKRFETRFIFVSDPARHIEEFVVTDAATGAEIYSSRDQEERSASR